MASKEANGLNKLLVSGLGPDITGELIEGFFEAQDMDIASVSVPEDGQAIVELTSGKDISPLLAKKHKLRQSTFTIKLINEMEKDELDDDRAYTIEVSYPEDMRHMLEVYFQGPKSGGRRDKAIEWLKDIESGKCHIKYESEEDAIAVSTKTPHVLMGKTFNVHCLSMKEQYEMDKVLVKGFPKSVNKDILIGFLDAKLELEHETDYVVKLNNSRAVIIFTEHQSAEELEFLCEKISNGKLKGCIISAERCNSIDVADILSSDKPASASSSTIPLCSSETDQYETDKLLLKDIPETTSSEVLAAFIDGKLDLEHETDYTLIMLKDTCAVIVFKKKISIEELNASNEKLSKGKLQGKMVSVWKCRINSPEMIEVNSILAAPPKQEYETDQLLITGIPEGVNKDFLIAFLDGRLQLDYESEYTLKMKKTCALVNFTQQYSEDDLNAFCETISSKKLRGETLTVAKCQVNCSVLIHKIGNKDYKSQDDLLVYFERNQSGAGRDAVEFIVMLSADRAKVTFKEPSVIVSVLSKDHSKLGSNVSVVACSPLDGLDGSFEEDDLSPSPIDNTPPKTRQPVIVHIDHLLGKYLQQKLDLLEALGREIQMSVLLNASAGIIELQTTESTPMDYSETSSNEQFQSLLFTQVCKTDIRVPPEAVKDLYPVLAKRCSSENMPMEFKEDVVSVAGLCESVLDLQKMAQQYCRRTIQITGRHTLTGEEYRFFTRCSMKQVEDKHQSLKFEFAENEDSFTLSFSGSVHDVEQFQEALPSLLSHAKVSVDVSRLVIAFLHKGKGFGILETIISHPSVLPYFSTDMQTLSLLCSHDDAQHAEAAALRIGKEIVEKELEVSPYFFTANVADSAKFYDFQQKTSKTYAFLCQVDKTKIKIVCRDQIVTKVSEVFEKFVAEECAITDKIFFKKGVWRLLNSALETKWNVLKEDMRKNEVSIVTSSKSTAPKPFVNIKGEHGKVDKIKAKILELQKLIKEERITKCRPGMVRYFLKDTKGKILLSGIESNSKVCIEVEVETDEIELETLIGSSRSGTNFKRICSANTKGGSAINVYVGDITTFNRAEVIVNAANEDLLHGAGVAGAIVDRGGPVINKDSNDYVQKYGKVSTGSAVLFPRVGNLPPPYKAIVHAVGPRWSSHADSHDKDIALLRKAVKTSLKLSQDYNSIAIPAISGGVFGFPPHISAGAVVKGVAEYLETSDPERSLTDINFVIFQNNVDVFKKAMSDHFTNVNTHDDVPAVSLAPIKTPSSDSERPHGTKTRRKRGSIKPNMSLEYMDLPLPSTPPVNAGVSSITSSSALKLVKVTKGDILKNQCEVLVNTTDQQLGFGGFVGRVLLKAAGQGLADECKEIPKPIQHGAIVTTGAHNLESQHMLHVVLPGYSGSQAETMLRSVVKKCLQECTRLKAKSISIPSIGAGNLGYPANVVANGLLEETTNYMSRNEGKTSLQLVHFVIFDGTVHQAFLDKYSRMESTDTNDNNSISQPKSSAIRNSRSSKSSPHATSKKSSLPSSSVHSHDAFEDTTCSFSLENGLLLQIVQGDITRERVDVVVNTTNPEMQLTGMGVAGALLKQGGPGLQAACDSLRQQGIQAGECKVVETPCEGMGQLKCKSIFHIVFEGKDQRKLVKTMLKCLDRAEKLRYTSIALPAIGTGNVAYPSSLAAEGIVKALKQFTQRKPRHVKQIRMVIFQPHMFQQFTDAFKKIEKTQGILNYIYDKGSKFLHSFGSLLIPNSDSEEDEAMEVSPSMDDSDNDDYDIIPMPDIPLDSAEVTLCIYGESETAVKRAVKQLTSLIDTTFITDEVDNEHIIELPRDAISALEEFAKQHAVDIDVDTDPHIHTIKLHGCQSDVLEVKDKIRDAIAEINNLKAASAVCKHVKWVRQCSDGPEEYDEITSFAIEQAYLQKKDIYSHDSGEEKFKVDFSKMEDFDVESGVVVKVQRIDFSQVEKPANWDPMPKDSNGREDIVHLVPLKQTSPEYIDALGKFNTTMQSRYQKIVSIQRIQNPVQYGQYVARKKEMDKRNPPGCQNETWLFHGTKHHVVENINTQGFNRSFKATYMYGQGVYFARDAIYSQKYAQPGPNQYCHMYLTRVLTGEFTVGQQNMVVPPPKPNQQNRNVLYDSTVDNTSSPSIFVVYNDAQAYAAYLITYQ